MDDDYDPNVSGGGALDERNPSHPRPPAHQVLQQITRPAAQPIGRPVSARSKWCATHTTTRVPRNNTAAPPCAQHDQAAVPQLPNVALCRWNCTWSIKQ